MKCISDLPDALLLKILSLIPAKDAVATMVLSKRWQSLWMMVPKLFYDDSYQDISYETFSRFVDRSLLLYEAPVLETLHFKLGKTCSVEDIRIWVRAADKCSVRELIIEFDSSSKPYPAILPTSLYTGCRMLVTLKLNNAVLVDVASLVSFPSLVTLDLISVKYPGDEFVKRLLSNCPVLEALVVRRAADDNVTIFTVTVPSLRSLFLRLSKNCVEDLARGFVIDTPCLELFDIDDFHSGFCIFESNMPNIVKADVDVVYCHPGKILSSITSVKQLYLCLLTSKDAYPVGCVFRDLVDLKICTCATKWLNLLMRLLGDSPKLRSLKLVQRHTCSSSRPYWIEPSSVPESMLSSLETLEWIEYEGRKEEKELYWIEPSSVPESMLSSLETLEWIEYEGRKEEKELVAFILRTGRNLKNVTISSKTTNSNKKLEMVKELILLSRRSPTCEFAFR